MKNDGIVILQTIVIYNYNTTIVYKYKKPTLFIIHFSLFIIFKIILIL